jgi:hypothetical protein
MKTVEGKSGSRGLHQMGDTGDMDYSCRGEHVRCGQTLIIFFR